MGLSTVIEIVHQEGERLVAAQRQRAPSISDDSPEAQRALLGPSVASVTDELHDVPPRVEDDSEEEQAECVATGFPGSEPPFPTLIPQDQPREVDSGFVIVELDEVKTKAQPSTGREEVWTYTPVVLVAGLRQLFAEATAEGLWMQAGALLLEWGVVSAEREGKSLAISGT